LPKRLPSPWWCVGVGKTLAAPCLKASRFRFPLPREAGTLMPEVPIAFQFWAIYN